MSEALQKREITKMIRKTFRQRRRQSAAIALAIISVLLAVSGIRARAQNQIRYYIEDLGTFSSSTRAYAINNAGQVTGYSFAAPAAAHAFRYTDGVGLVDLNLIAHENNAYGAGINSFGQVSGSVDRSGGAGGYHAFRYTDGVGLIDLGTLPGYAFSYGGALNDLGQVVGSANRSSSDVLRAFRFTDGAGMQDLGTLGGGSAAYGINNSGDVVGLSVTRATPPGDFWNPGHAFLYTDASGMVDLNKLIDRSLGWELRQANAINDNKQITGYGEHTGVGLHAFRYSEGMVQDLGTFPGGGISYGVGINNRGDVVGAAYLDASGVGNFRAMLYTDRGRMQNLNNLIDPALGWVLRVATGINKRGQIAGWGEFNGDEHAFRLTPLVGFFYDE